jgi:hypothetical protein
MTTLTRRFIIICLIFVIFAMLMAAAVANAGRDKAGWRRGAIDVCAFRSDPHCKFRR